MAMDFTYYILLLAIKAEARYSKTFIVYIVMNHSECRGDVCVTGGDVVCGCRADVRQNGGR